MGKGRIDMVVKQLWVKIYQADGLQPAHQLFVAMHFLTKAINCCYAGKRERVKILAQGWSQKSDFFTNVTIKP
jgi:hypothetical protein